MTLPGQGPLAGFTVGVTAHRRRGELAALLERRGARVVQAPAIRLVPLPDDTELLRATQACLAAPLDDVVVTTGVGFRAWIETADGWGLAGALIRRLSGARILARGPKARGAVRATGLTEAWSPPSESSAELLSYVLADAPAGRRIAVQLHGGDQAGFMRALRHAGAEVIEVPVYRWAPPDDPAPVLRLVEDAAHRTVDALTFTSAPAVTGLLRVAEAAGLRDPLLDALRTDVVPACVGPVTAGPLEQLGVPTLQPDRARIGALARVISAHLPGRVRRLRVDGHDLELRGRLVVVDDELRPVPPASTAVLRALARRPGHVLSRAELRAAIGGTAGDDHAVEMAVARLRRALGCPGIVTTVVKRGYRLACEPAEWRTAP